MATLLCEECLRDALNDLQLCFAQRWIPIGDEEGEEHSLTRQVGVLITPISITSEESQLLVDELKTDDRDCVVNEC
jgi:hypothetical protein